MSYPNWRLASIELEDSHRKKNGSIHLWQSIQWNIFQLTAYYRQGSKMHSKQSDFEELIRNVNEAFEKAVAPGAFQDKELVREGTRIYTKRVSSLPPEQDPDAASSVRTACA